MCGFCNEGFLTPQSGWVYSPEIAPMLKRAARAPPAGSAHSMASSSPMACQLKSGSQAHNVRTDLLIREVVVATGAGEGAYRTWVLRNHSGRLPLCDTDRFQVRPYRHPFHCSKCCTHRLHRRFQSRELSVLLQHLVVAAHAFHGVQSQHRYRLVIHRRGNQGRNGTVGMTHVDHGAFPDCFDEVNHLHRSG